MTNGMCILYTVNDDGWLEERKAADIEGVAKILNDMGITTLAKALLYRTQDDFNSDLYNHHVRYEIEELIEKKTISGSWKIRESKKHCAFQHYDVFFANDNKIECIKNITLIGIIDILSKKDFRLQLDDTRMIMVQDGKKLYPNDFFSYEPEDFEWVVRKSWVE